MSVERPHLLEPSLSPQDRLVALHYAVRGGDGIRQTSLGEAQAVGSVFVDALTQTIGGAKDFGHALDGLRFIPLANRSEPHQQAIHYLNGLALDLVIDDLERRRVNGGRGIFNDQEFAALRNHLIMAYDGGQLANGSISRANKDKVFERILRDLEAVGSPGVAPLTASHPASLSEKTPYRPEDLIESLQKRPQEEAENDGTMREQLGDSDYQRGIVAKIGERFHRHIEEGRLGDFFDSSMLTIIRFPHASNPQQSEMNEIGKEIKTVHLSDTKDALMSFAGLSQDHLRTAYGKMEEVLRAKGQRGPKTTKDYEYGLKHRFHLDITVNQKKYSGTFSIADFMDEMATPEFESRVWSNDNDETDKVKEDLIVSVIKRNLGVDISAITPDQQMDTNLFEPVDKVVNGKNQGMYVSIEPRNITNVKSLVNLMFGVVGSAENAFIITGRYFSTFDQWLNKNYPYLFRNAQEPGTYSQGYHIGTMALRGFMEKLYMSYFGENNGNLNILLLKGETTVNGKVKKLSGFYRKIIHPRQPRLAELYGGNIHDTVQVFDIYNGLSPETKIVQERFKDLDYLLMQHNLEPSHAPAAHIMSGKCKRSDGTIESTFTPASTGEVCINPRTNKPYNLLDRREKIEFMKQYSTSKKDIDEPHMALRKFDEYQNTDPRFSERWSEISFKNAIILEMYSKGYKNNQIMDFVSNGDQVMGVRGLRNYIVYSGYNGFEYNNRFNLEASLSKYDRYLEAVANNFYGFLGLFNSFIASGLKGKARDVVRQDLSKAGAQLGGMIQKIAGESMGHPSGNDRYYMLQLFIDAYIDAFGNKTGVHRHKVKKNGNEYEEIPLQVKQDEIREAQNALAGIGGRVRPDGMVAVGSRPVYESVFDDNRRSEAHANTGQVQHQSKMITKGMFLSVIEGMKDHSVWVADELDKIKEKYKDHFPEKWAQRFSRERVAEAIADAINIITS